MAHTYQKLLYHIVWSTKDRQPLIFSAQETRLYKYIIGTMRVLKCKVMQIGGTSDHIHLVADIPSNLTISEVIRNVKVSSCKWITREFSDVKGFAWQIGYGIFSVSYSRREDVINYVCHQKVHHKKIDFRSEFLELLSKHKVEFQEKYLWK